MAKIKGLLNKFISYFLKHNKFRVDSSEFWSKSSFIRLGTTYGGWHIPKHLKLTENDNCYLAGAGEDISFDCELAKLFPCNLYIFDPTPKAQQHFKNLQKAVAEQHIFAINNTEQYYKISASDFQKIHFYPWGVAGQNSQLKFYMPANPDHVSCSVLNLQKTEEYFEADCFTISTLCKKLAHDSISLLKLDIEGAEYQVIQDIVDNGPLPYLLLVEFDEIHTPLDKEAPSRVNKHINLLRSKGMQHIFMEGSNATFINIRLIN